MLLENIKRLCEEEGISTYALAIKCGLTGGAIDKWKDSSPTVGSLKKVADYFGVTLDELLRETTDP